MTNETICRRAQEAVIEMISLSEKGRMVFHSAFIEGAKWMQEQLTASHDLDARIREEHGEMLEMLKEMEREYHYFGIEDRIQSLIQKIETK